MKIGRKKKNPDGPENDAPQGDESQEGGDAREGGAPSSDAPDEVAEPELDETERLARDLGEMHDKWLRSKAEMENLRKRTRSDIDDARRYGASALLAELLDVMDNLQRALAAPPEGIDAPFLEGLQLIEQQWSGVLARHGVKSVSAEAGQGFDPQVHNALMEQETSDQPAGSIVAEIKRGYRLHDRLLREAHVVVAKAPSAPAPDADDDDAGGHTPDAAPSDDRPAGN